MKAMDALEAMTGTYMGSWDHFGLGPDGTVQKMYSTEDTATASDVHTEEDRAYVSVRDRMQLPGGREMTLEFQEGFLLEADGRPGARYFEMFGQRVIEQPLGDHAWAYQTRAAPQELEQMGFRPADVISATHTTVKNEVVCGSSEVQLVTRITTVHFRDEAGTPRARQFISMSGVHTRELAK